MGLNVFRIGRTWWFLHSLATSKTTFRLAVKGKSCAMPSGPENGVTAGTRVENLRSTHVYA